MALILLASYYAFNIRMLCNYDVTIYFSFVEFCYANQMLSKYHCVIQTESQTSLTYNKIHAPYLHKKVFLLPKCLPHTEWLERSANHHQTLN